MSWGRRRTSGVAPCYESQDLRSVLARPLYSIRMAPSKQVFLDSHSSGDRPPVVEMRRADGRLLQTVCKADVSTLMNELKWRAPEEFVVKAADGNTNLYGVLYKPYDFDPNKKYPVLQYFGTQRTFYGDPRTAQLGYSVVTASGRGTEGRGKAFQNADRGHLGQFEIADQVAVLKQVAATRPFMDLTRVGVLGASYPGFMTTRAMLLAPDVYRAGVAIDAISEMAAHWRNEGLLGPPETNRAAYEYASNLRLAGEIKGRLLLIHGTSDMDVPISHTIRMVDAHSFDLANPTTCSYCRSNHMWLAESVGRTCRRPSACTSRST